MQAMKELGTRIARPMRLPFEMEADELVGWDLPTDLAVASADEIEVDLALGDPAWGSLLRVAE